MSEIQASAFNEILQYIRVVVVSVSGVVVAFLSVFIAGARFLLNISRQYSKLEKRLEFLEKYKSDQEEREIARSFFTTSIYGLSDRTSSLVARVDAVEANADRANDRCERMHEPEPWDGKTERRSR